MHRPDRGAEGASVVTLLAFPLNESGGIAAFVRSLSACLEAGYDAAFRLIAPPSSDAGQSTRWSQMRFAFGTLGALKQVRPLAIQTHENLPLLCAAIAYKLLFSGSVRVFHTVHVDPADRKPWWKRTSIGCLFALCNRIVVVSEDTRRRLSNTALPVRRNVGVIYGAAPHASPPSTEALTAFVQSFGLGPGPVICQITRFYYPLKVKGAERLLEAFRLVREAIPEAQMLLVGSGPLWSEFRERHGLQVATGGVTLTGFVDDPLVPMALADVYCHISFQDALPIVVLEAMSFGKAVVASAVGGIPEAIEDNVCGVLTTSTVEDLSSKLIRLLQTPGDAVALGSEAKRHVDERFKWDRCAAQYAALYGIQPKIPARRGVPAVALSATGPLHGGIPDTPGNRRLLPSPRVLPRT